MKIKYMRLSKEEKKDAWKRYYETPKGTNNKKRLSRAFICSCLCIFFSFYLIYDAFVNTNKLIDEIYGIGILIIGIVMLLFAFNLRVKLINNFITIDELKIKNTKKKKK